MDYSNKQMEEKFVFLSYHSLMIHIPNSHFDQCLGHLMYYDNIYNINSSRPLFIIKM